MKVSSNKIALFTVIENSETNIGAGNAWREWDSSNPESEPLEEEAIRCFKSWRKNAGWLKDIDIYCICPSNKKPKMETINTIKSLNVCYIEHYFEETEHFDCGYMNVPLVGKWLEEEYKDKNDHFIHIDLDMTVINPIPEEYFFHPVTIGALDELKPWSWVHKDKINFNLESCFIISHYTSEFYTVWNKHINYFYKYGTIDKIPKKYIAELEEYALDSMYYDIFLSCKWKVLEHQYQIGERYPIRDDIDIDKVLFHHNHTYESTDALEEYTKLRLKTLSSKL